MGQALVSPCCHGTNILEAEGRAETATGCHVPAFILSGGLRVRQHRDTEGTPLLVLNKNNSSCLKKDGFSPTEVWFIQSAKQKQPLSFSIEWQGAASTGVHCESLCLGLKINRHSLDIRLASKVDRRSPWDLLDDVKLTNQAADDANIDRFEIRLSKVRPDTHALVFVTKIIAKDAHDIRGVEGFRGQIRAVDDEEKVVEYLRFGDMYDRERQSYFSANVIVQGMFIRDASDWFFVTVNEAVNIIDFDSEVLLQSVKRLITHSSLMAMYNFCRSRVKHQA
eukprot:gnl/TRDRNA2_/TRDRNA2_40441_c0_seq1.p1 gnl/TRDRNA2_/TRDRNA2_40441_c0~~gnl/TRDRNA2_/TRDRNA2_40441_c0_seq1.p1  ORF type:complete len:297 (-),score=38.13 gnl/TRDRNA2_/TRDRNA2_40441_c0_seq1:158-997(-)